MARLKTMRSHCLLEQSFCGVNLRCTCFSTIGSSSPHCAFPLYLILPQPDCKTAFTSPPFSFRIEVGVNLRGCVKETFPRCRVHSVEFWCTVSFSRVLRKNFVAVLSDFSNLNIFTSAL